MGLKLLPAEGYKEFCRLFLIDSESVILLNLIGVTALKIVTGIFVSRKFGFIMFFE